MTDQTNNNATTGTPASFDLNRTVTFNFKKVKEQDFMESLEDSQKNDPDFLAQFEMITDGEGEKARKYVKRKSFNGVITLPASIAAIPEQDRETVAQILERELQQFVKTQYIDNFEAIGAHDLETYRSVVNTRGSRAAWDYTPEQFAAAIESLEKYISKAVGNNTVGKKFADAAKQKFSRSAIQRYLGNFEEQLLKKINVRLGDWGNYVVENEPANADEFAVIFDMLGGAIDKHMKAEIVDVSKFL